MNWLILLLVATLLAYGFIVADAARKRVDAERARANAARAAHMDICADLLEVRGDLAEVTAERDAYLERIKALATEKARVVIALDNERADHRALRMVHDAQATAVERSAWLPDLEGNYLDVVENLPVGWRLDWADFTQESPIGMEVLSDHIADVVPIDKGARR